MRKLGMIGGLSWVSTALYYEQINKGVNRRVGGVASAPLVIESVDFGRFSALQHSGRWDEAAAMLANCARRLEAAGAGALVLCSNSCHKVYDQVAAAVAIPLLHIGDITAAKLVADGVKRAGLIGTRFTMDETFYRERIEAHGIELSVPDPGMAKEIDRIIFEELVRGTVSRVSQRTLKTCLTVMGQARNQAAILGCTELVTLVDPGANVLPIYDTTAIHAAAAVDWILGEAPAPG
ncbi:MAG TPA: amino acid racemase [Allosphingosinicella sp.]|nr:amino acid racemase [Allosphingosinicella sp.]